MILGYDEIKRRILAQEMVSDYVNLEKQLQPSGFDLTVGKIERFQEESRGVIDFSNQKRILPSTVEVSKEGNVWELDEGVYLVTFGETIKLPNHIFAMTNQRSSVMRCGVFTQIGYWDSGYHGKGQSILIVKNPTGLVLCDRARISQMIFMHVMGNAKSYSGKYQFENL